MKRENIVPISVVCQQVHSDWCKTFNLSLSTNASQPFCLLSFDSLEEDFIFDVFLEKENDRKSNPFLRFSHVKYYFLIKFFSQQINQSVQSNSYRSKRSHALRWISLPSHGLDQSWDHFQSTLGRCLSLPLFFFTSSTTFRDCFQSCCFSHPVTDTMKCPDNCSLFHSLIKVDWWHRQAESRERERARV